MDRRQIIVGGAATAVIAAMPTAVEAAVAEHSNELLRGLLRFLLEEGYAVARFKDGGKVLFWLGDRNDISSLLVMPLEDGKTENAVELLRRCEAIHPTIVRL